jgi:HSP20 family molecular chaperone IbpA
VKNVPEDIDDFIDKIKKYFKIDSDKFDVDFLFIPESEKGLDLKPKFDKSKGFKISYHFETGMEKPEIRFEGNFDDKRIREYFKNIDLLKSPNLKKIFETTSIEEIDASELSLEISEFGTNNAILEPHTEINDYQDFTEILLEVPGLSEEDIVIDIKERGTKLIFKAEGNNRKYNKSVYLPFKSSNNDYELEVKNGLAIIKVKKSKR